MDIQIGLPPILKNIKRKPLRKGDYVDKQVAWTSESISRRRATWNAWNRNRLKNAFPEGERAFCRIMDKFKHKLCPMAKRLLFYRRQMMFPVAPEVVFYGDFYFKSFKLLIEIDGGGHLSKDAREKDSWRTKLIGAGGIIVARFPNDAVLFGDFREVEDEFVKAALSVPGHGGIKRILKSAVLAAKDANPHIYSVPSPVSREIFRDANEPLWNM